MRRKQREGYQTDNGASSYRRFLDGDDEGLTLIIKDYKDGLILYLNGYVSNIYVAEEIMEETFFKLAVKKPKFNEKSSFKTWLYTIGRNVAIDYIRHNSKFSMYSIEDMENYLKPFNRETVLDERYIKVNSNSETCIDDINLYILFEDNKITDIHFDGEACAISTSATSIMIKLLFIDDNYDLKDIGILIP